MAKSRSTRSRVRPHMPYAPPIRERLLVADPSDPEHLEAIRRIASLGTARRLSTRAASDTSSLDRCVCEILSRPNDAAQLVGFLLRALGIPASYYDQTVSYSTLANHVDLRHPRTTPTATQRALCMSRPGVRDECDAWVPEVVAFLANLCGGEPPTPEQRREIFDRLAAPDAFGPRSTYTTDTPFLSNRLVLEANRHGMQISIDRPFVENICVPREATADERDDSGGDDGVRIGDARKAIATLYGIANVEPSVPMLVTPNADGWTVGACEDPPSVFVETATAPDETVLAVRDLHSVLGDGTPDPRPYDAEDDLMVLVHGRTGYKSVVVTPDDMVETIREVARLVEYEHGDPGATFSLARRVEGVLKELQRRAGS